MNANERYEYLAEEFYKRTGMMAPGKDCPIGMHEREERESAFSDFLDSFYGELLVMHKNAIENKGE